MIFEFNGRLAIPRDPWRYRCVKLGPRVPDGERFLSLTEVAERHGQQPWDLVTIWLSAWGQHLSPAETAIVLGDVPAIVVRQPFASLICAGRKTIEVRGWSTSYRGPLLIVAGKRAPAEPWARGLPRGVALCLVELVDVRPMVDDDALAAGVAPRAGALAWVLRGRFALPAIPVRGRLGLFRLGERGRAA